MARPAPTSRRTVPGGNNQPEGTDLNEQLKRRTKPSANAAATARQHAPPTNRPPVGSIIRETMAETSRTAGKRCRPHKDTNRECYGELRPLKEQWRSLVAPQGGTRRCRERREAGRQAGGAAGRYGAAERMARACEGMFACAAAVQVWQLGVPLFTPQTTSFKRHGRTSRTAEGATTKQQRKNQSHNK